MTNIGDMSLLRALFILFYYFMLIDYFLHMEKKESELISMIVLIFLTN